MQDIDPEHYAGDGKRCDKPVLANLGRECISGRYLPYECAVSRVIIAE